MLLPCGFGLFVRYQDTPVYLWYPRTKFLHLSSINANSVHSLESEYGRVCRVRLHTVKNKSYKMKSRLSSGNVDQLNTISWPGIWLGQREPR